MPNKVEQMFYIGVTFLLLLSGRLLNISSLGRHEVRLDEVKHYCRYPLVHHPQSEVISRIKTFWILYEMYVDCYLGEFLFFT